MIDDKDIMSIKVARLYYESGYSQMEIATELALSRPTISRLLQYAKDKGYVQITINDPLDDNSAMEQELAKKYNLNVVRIAVAPLNSDIQIKQAITLKAAEYLDGIVRDGDIIGVSWGTTLYQLAQFIKPKPLKGVQIVQLKGGISHSTSNTYAYEIIETFAKAYGAVGRYLPLPVMFDSVSTKQIVEQDKHIESLLTLGKQANIAVFTVGPIDDTALLFRLGYLTECLKHKLQLEGAGDVCSHFINKGGKICERSLDERTVGISLEALSSKDKRIVVAGGKAKLAALKATLNGGIANVLITDQYTARELLLTE